MIGQRDDSTDRHRWFEVAGGQGAAARAYLSDMTVCLHDRHGVTVDGFTEVFGPSSASRHLMIDFDDLVAFESWWGGLASDADFGKLHAVEQTISIEGTTRQALLHSHTA